MGIFIILGIIFIICIISGIIGTLRDNCDLAFFGYFFTILAIGGIIGCGCTLINRGRTFESQIIEYNNTKALVESYKGKEYGNTPALTEKIIDINDLIAKHKAFAGNWFTGIWFSEKIGNLEPIVFDSNI